MKRHLLLSLSLMILGAQGSSQPAGFKERADSLIQYLYTSNMFSGSVCLQQGDRVMYSVNLNRFAPEEQKYCIGSVSKVFTALIIYQLIEEGKLSLETRLGQFIPEIKYSGQITIDQMLSHTSGIFNITDREDYYSLRSRHFTRQEIIHLITENKPEFKPGQDCSYSNSNYILLGFIIEDISSKPYAVNISERITSRLGLDQTYCRVHAGQDDIYSCKFDGESWNRDLDSDPALPGAAGAMVSSTVDLARLMSAIFNHRLISDSSLAHMKKLVSRSTGHGIFKAPFYDKEGWGHTGRIDEFRAFAGYFPADSLCLAVTSNGMNMILNDIAAGLLSLYYGRPYSFPEAGHPVPETPSSETFAGTYRARLFGFIPVGKMLIIPAGRNHLFMREYNKGYDSEQTLLVRTDTQKFHSPEIGWNLEFQMNRKGKPNKLTMRQGKVAIKCKKLRRS